MGRFWIVAVMVSVMAGVFSVACANQPPSETRDGATPSKDEEPGGETTSSAVDRAVLMGVLTAVDREAGGESGPIGSLLVEEPPGAECGEGPADPGCEKIYFRIIDDTRVFREQGGGQQVEASPGDLEKGQIVRADYTGYPLAESYPAQTTARTVVILEPAPSASAAGVFFPRQRPGGDVMMAETRGELSLDDDGCLRTKGAAGYGGTVPVWPADFRVDTQGNEIRVLDREDRVVARVGEEVYMGGGEVGRSLEGIGGVSEKTKRELRERCPGTYWLVGTGVTIP